MVNYVPVECLTNILNSNIKTIRNFLKQLSTLFDSTDYVVL